jgi:hypothetical protein
MHLTEVISHLFHPRRSNNHRPRILHPEAFATFAVMAFLLFVVVNVGPRIFQTPGNVLGFASSISASDVVIQTNQQRAGGGLGALTVNSRLNEAAQAKAQHMFSNQYWAHIAPDGTTPWAFFKRAGYGYSVAGENLARDFDNTGDMVGAWMASPSHRANIMNSRYTEIGVAVVNGTLQGTETTLVVQFFGTPGSAKPKITPAAQTDTKKVAQSSPKPASPKPSVKPQTQGAETTADSASAAAQASPAPTEEGFAEQQPTTVQEANGAAEILGGQSFALSSLREAPLFSPLQLMKAFFLAMIFMIIATLAYDTVIMSHRNTVRLVGKNFAHILLFAVIAFLVFFFKSGVIG